MSIPPFLGPKWPKSSTAIHPSRYPHGYPSTLEAQAEAEQVEGPGERKLIAISFPGHRRAPGQCSNGDPRGAAPSAPPGSAQVTFFLGSFGGSIPIWLSHSWCDVCQIVSLFFQRIINDHNDLLNWSCVCTCSRLHIPYNMSKTCSQHVLLCGWLSWHEVMVQPSFVRKVASLFQGLGRFLNVCTTSRFIPVDLWSRNLVESSYCRNHPTWKQWSFMDLYG